jgi:hypothetical protein
MPLNNATLNSEILNDYTVSDITYDSQSILTFGKDIVMGAVYSNYIARVYKVISYDYTGSSLIRVGKVITTPASDSFYNRNGWDPIITVGGKTLAARELTGSIKVTKTEGSNTTASFSIILYPNTYTLYDYQAKPVTISVKKDGVVTKLFTGLVDVPELNVFEEKLTLNCTADRRVLLGNLASIEPYIGYYAEGVLGTNLNAADRITQRMTTIPASLDFDSSNNYSITSWTAKTTPDYAFGSSSVYRREPQLIMDSSSQIINKVNITLEYGYVRHHQAQCYTSWLHPYANTVCPFLQDMPTCPSRNMIRAAAQSAGWLVDNDSFDFTNQLASGFYHCDGTWLAWSLIETGVQNAQILDSNGRPVLDSSGNPTYRSVPTIIADNSKRYAMGANWFSYKRYNQNIKESYTVSVTSPESVAKYGEIPSDQSYGYTAVDAYDDFTSATAYSYTMGASFHIDGVTDRNKFNDVYMCALQKARTQILKSHRRNKMVFQVPLLPSIELRHTASLTGKWVMGKGKVYSITHVMGISDSSGGASGDSYTDISLMQYRGTTTVSETSLAIPTVPAEGAINNVFGAVLDTHLGEDPAASGASAWNGYIGNVWTFKSGGSIGGNYIRTNYTESFVVDSPTIPTNLTDNKVLTKSVTYNVNIPNDNTVYQSYG